MVAELVDEDVVGRTGVDRDRRVVVEDAAAAVVAVVDQDLHGVVRRGRRDVAPRRGCRGSSAYRSLSKMLYSVPTRPRRIVAGARVVDAALRGRRRSIARTLKSRAPALVRLDREHRARRAASRRRGTSGSSRLGVAVAESSRSTFVSGGPLSQSVQTLPAGARRARFTCRDAGSTMVGPELVERVQPIALLQHDLHRALRPREPERLAEGPVGVASPRRSSPTRRTWIANPRE